jgi:sec-independent protein translocase protein TatC
MISVNEYFDLILLTLLCIGLMFELPVLIFFLSLFGIVTPKFLLKNFRYAILVIAIGAAIAAPPDALSMLVFMAPMVGLYFLGVLVSAVVVKRRERRIGAPAEAR